MKIGIVGANGFIGRHLCQRFLAVKFDVFAFYHRQKNQIPPTCQLIQIESNFNENLDFLFISIGNFKQEENEFITQTFELKKMIQKINFKRIIFISSTDIYNETEEVIKLNSSTSIRNNYTEAKIKQELIIKDCQHYSIIRPTYLYGNGMNIHSLVPTWIKQAKTENQITIFGAGKREQDYLHIEDFADLCLNVISNFKENSTILVASGQSVSNLELAKIIQKNFINCKLKFIDGTEGLSRNFDVGQTKRDYNWNPKIAMFEGLKKYIHNENIDI